MAYWLFRNGVRGPNGDFGASGVAPLPEVRSNGQVTSNRREADFSVRIPTRAGPHHWWREAETYCEGCLLRTIR